MFVWLVFTVTDQTSQVNVYSTMFMFTKWKESFTTLAPSGINGYYSAAVWTFKSSMFVREASTSTQVVSHSMITFQRPLVIQLLQAFYQIPQNILSILWHSHIVMVMCQIYAKLIRRSLS